MDRVCHFEIPYTDKAGLQKFYKEVFGWDIQDFPGDMPYSMVTTTPMNEQFQPQQPGGINGGMYERSEEGSRTPVIVIEVESCEQRAKDVEAAGGSVVMSVRQIADMGIYAQVQDTDGNIIGLWQPLHGG